MNRFAFLFVGLAALFSFGCGGMKGVVKTRAAYDFGCTKEDITLRNIGGTSFVAEGCGKRGVYTCVQSYTPGYACTPEQEKPELMTESKPGTTTTPSAETK